MEIKQNTLFLTTPGLYINRDGLTLCVEQDRELKLAIPIHHLQSVCIFGPMTFTPQALQLCFENDVGVNYFSENGFFLGRWEGVANTSVLLRRSQYRMADDAVKSCNIAKQIVAGKIQNCRQSLLRSSRENESQTEQLEMQEKAEELVKNLRLLQGAQETDSVRGFEGMAANHYFSCFTFHLKQQREHFSFTSRSRRPPLDRINCLLSYLYSLILHDCIAALTSVGLDPYVGFLHVDRANRPSLALDMMEEFRPLLADRLAITMVNRKQIGPDDFKNREGGAVEFTDVGRKNVISAYQSRKQDELTHPILEEACRVGQLFHLQARILARHIRGDLPDYLPCVIK